MGVIIGLSVLGYLLVGVAVGGVQYRYEYQAHPLHSEERKPWVTCVGLFWPISLIAWGVRWIGRCLYWMMECVGNWIVGWRGK